MASEYNASSPVYVHLLVDDARPQTVRKDIGSRMSSNVVESSTMPTNVISEPHEITTGALSTVAHVAAFGSEELISVAVKLSTVLDAMIVNFCSLERGVEE